MLKPCFLDLWQRWCSHSRCQIPPGSHRERNVLGKLNLPTKERDHRHLLLYFTDHISSGSDSIDRTNQIWNHETGINLLVSRNFREKRGFWNQCLPQKATDIKLLGQLHRTVRKAVKTKSRLQRKKPSIAVASRKHNFVYYDNEVR